MERRINRIIRDLTGRVIRSPETGGFALPEAYEVARNTVFLLKPLYPGEEPPVLFRRFDDEMRYTQRIYRQAYNHPAAVQVDPYRVPFTAAQKQQAFRSLVEGEGGVERLVTELEVACDDDAPYPARWEVRDRILQEGPGNPVLVERLVRLLGSETVVLRLLAVEVLSLVGDALVVPSLFKALHEDPHPDVRGFAGLALGILGIREARLPLIHRALQAPDAGERHDLFCALALLGGLGGEAPGLRLEADDLADPTADLRSTILVSVTEGLEGVAAILWDHQNPRGQRLACLSLLELASPRDVLPLLIPVSDDPDEIVAAGALQVAAVLIGRAQDDAVTKEAAAFFTRVLNESKRARSREIAAVMVGRLGNASVIEMLDRRGLGDPDFLVRDAAERALRLLEDRLYGRHRIRPIGDADVGAFWRR